MMTNKRIHFEKVCFYPWDVWKKYLESNPTNALTYMSDEEKLKQLITINKKE